MPNCSLAASARLIQAACGLAAMVLTSLGYVKLTSGQLSSAAAILTTVAGYTAFLSGIYHGVFVEMLSKCPAPKAWFQRTQDLLLAGALALAGGLHVTSSAFETCDAINESFSTYHGGGLFRCGALTVSVVLTFATAGVTVLSLLLSFRHQQASDNEQARNEEGVATTDLTALEKPALRFTRRTARLLQFGCSVAALVTTVTGYRHYYTGQYTSPAATYTILMSYSAMLLSAWHVASVETLKLSARPVPVVERTMDGLLAVALLVAGIVFVSSAQVEDCSTQNDNFAKYHGTELFRCGNMNVGVVFTFLSVVLLAATLALSFIANDEEPLSIARASKDRSALHYVRIVGRLLQAVCGALGLVFTSLSYVKFTTGQLSSAPAIFTNVACYSAVVEGLYYALWVELLQKTPGPKVWAQRAVDLALVVMLTIGGSLHAASDAVQACDDYNYWFETIHGSGIFRCGSMSVSIAMAFVTMAISLVHVALSFFPGGVASRNVFEEHDGFQPMQTPNADKPHEDGALRMAEPKWLSALHKVARLAQILCSSAALITVAVGYKPYYTGQYTSPSATYALLAAYTGVVYALLQLVTVETFHVCRRPVSILERSVDALLAVALLVAGFIFMNSTQVEDCETRNDSFAEHHGTDLFRCGSMDAGVVLSFIAVATFALTFALNLTNRRATHDVTASNVETELPDPSVHRASEAASAAVPSAQW